MLLNPYGLSCGFLYFLYICGDTRIIDREVSKYLHREMVKTLQNIQALNSDLLALGEIYRMRYPLDWQKIEWEQVYPEAGIELVVRFTTKSFGLLR